MHPHVWYGREHGKEHDVFLTVCCILTVLFFFLHQVSIYIYICTHYIVTIATVSKLDLADLAERIAATCFIAATRTGPHLCLLSLFQLFHLTLRQFGLALCSCGSEVFISPTVRSLCGRRFYCVMYKSCWLLVLHVLLCTAMYCYVLLCTANICFFWLCHVAS